jgi:hypothetical protein
MGGERSVRPPGPGPLSIFQRERQTAGRVFENLMGIFFFFSFYWSPKNRSERSSRLAGDICPKGTVATIRR